MREYLISTANAGLSETHDGGTNDMVQCVSSWPLSSRQQEQ